MPRWIRQINEKFGMADYHMLYLRQKLGLILLCEAVSCLLCRENSIGVQDLSIGTDLDDLEWPWTP